MHWGLTELLALSVALAMDAFSVALVIGLTHQRARQLFRLSFHFGLFQAGMPLIGALLAGRLAGHATAHACWVGFFLLGAIGLHMLYEAYQGGASHTDEMRDRTRGLSLIGLSVATSIDALGAGVPLGLGDADLVLAVSLIGVTAVALTLVGMLSGARLQRWVGHRAGYLGGAVLIALGVRMLLEI